MFAQDISDDLKFKKKWIDSSEVFLVFSEIIMWIRFLQKFPIYYKQDICKFCFVAVFLRCCAGSG